VQYMWLLLTQIFSKNFSFFAHDYSQQGGNRQTIKRDNEQLQSNNQRKLKTAVKCVRYTGRQKHCRSQRSMLALYDSSAIHVSGSRHLQNYYLLLIVRLETIIDNRISQ